MNLTNVDPSTANATVHRPTGHLIHIGFPKTGSSYLQRWFARHPQIESVDGGIAGFANLFALIGRTFDTGDAPRWRVTSGEGLSIPSRAAGRLADDRDLPDPAAVAAARRQACRWLAEIFPDAHVLIVTRGFRAMIMSSYSQYVRVGGDQDLESLERRCADQANVPWHYDAIVAEYRKAFANRVIVLPYEAFAADRRGFLDDLACRLNVARFDLGDHQVNAALSSSELRWYPRFARLVRRMPDRGGVVWRAYVRAAFRNRLRLPIAFLNRLWPAAPVLPSIITDASLRSLEPLAARLITEPPFALYADAYRAAPACVAVTD